MRIDGHIHIERGPYTLECIKQFVDKAVEMKLDEIRLLEHNFIFEEFACMYDEVCEESAFDHTAELWEGRDVDKIYRRYFEDSVDLVRSGLFSEIGHPDTIKLFGHKPSFPLTEYYEKLAKEISKANMYADQNSGAYRRNPKTASLGMNPELISILKNNNVKFITSSDAHCSEEVGYMITELEQAIM